MSEKPGKPCSCPRCLVELAAAEERGRRAEHERATSVIHVLHQCIRGKCACADNGAYSQFACEDTAREAIDAWDLAPRDSGQEGDDLMRALRDGATVSTRPPTVRK